MDMKHGYKQTMVGVIPGDWDEIEYTRIGDIIDGDRGVNYPGAGIFQKNGHCLFLNAGNVTKTGFQFEDCQFISADRDGKLNKGKLSRQDVVLTTRGTLGNLAYYSEEVPYNHIRINSGMVIMRCTSSTVDHAYHYFVLRSHIVGSQIERLSFGSAQPQLTVKGIETLKIPLPPTKAEQKAIAEALSDTDAHIESLEQLLTKKRQIKKGAMQELLTGKTRLPGFSGEWEVKCLGEFGSTFGGLTGKTKNDFGRGTSHYITFMNIMINVVIDCSTFELVDVQPTESQNRVAKGDLFFNGSSETPEEVGMCSILTQDVQHVYVNSFCFGFRFRDGAPVDGLYIALFFRSQEGRKLLKSLAQGSTRYNLSKTALSNVAFPCPLQAEQTAIANILSDMDAEITSLEAKLSKARQLKQGMMQELLTGRIRLV